MKFSDQCSFNSKENLGGEYDKANNKDVRCIGQLVYLRIAIRSIYFCNTNECRISTSVGMPICSPRSKNQIFVFVVEGDR
jgi:hypothetical protein